MLAQEVFFFKHIFIFVLLSVMSHSGHVTLNPYNDIMQTVC